MKTQIFERAIVSAGIVALLAMLLPSAAWAQGSGWYVAGGLGASFPNDVDIGATVTAELDTGILGTAAVGASGGAFGNFRVEAEVLYNTNDVSTLSVAGVGSVNAGGDISTLGLMVNGYYDFDTDSKWKPFIGGGIGGANVSINSLSAGGAQLDDDAWAFAYQVKVGVAYEFTQALAGTLGYRFFGTDDPDFVDSSSGAAFSTDGIQAHVIELGMRYRF